MNLTGCGTVAGIMGWPVAHSLSPVLHGFWLREHALDGAYVPLPILREEFSTALTGLRMAGFAGVNVTVPHKEAAFALAHEVDEAARATGAVNLLLFRNDRIVGCNTDVDGLKVSLEEGLGRGNLRGITVAVLGSGGAARAAILACDRLEVRAIRILNRNGDRALSLAEAARPHLRAELDVCAWADWARAADGIGLLVNATSGGMNGAGRLELNLDDMPRDAAVCDVVYNPLETELLNAARARGHRTLDGLGMLMHQAVPAFEAFYGIKPRISIALRAELERALQREG